MKILAEISFVSSILIETSFACVFFLIDLYLIKVSIFLFLLILVSSIL